MKRNLFFLLCFFLLFWAWKNTSFPNAKNNKATINRRQNTIFVVEGKESNSDSIKWKSKKCCFTTHRPFFPRFFIRWDASRNSLVEKNILCVHFSLVNLIWNFFLLKWHIYYMDWLALATSVSGCCTHNKHFERHILQDLMFSFLFSKIARIIPERMFNTLQK